MRSSLFPLWALAFLTVASAGSMVVLIFMVDPTFADFWTFWTLYASLFVAVTAVVSWGALFLRARFSRVRRPMAYFFGEAVRHGAFAAAILTASLMLQAHNRLTFPIALGLVAAVFLLEALIVRRAASL